MPRDSFKFKKFPPESESAVTVFPTNYPETVTKTASAQWALSAVDAAAAPCITAVRNQQLGSPLEHMFCCR